MARWSKKELQEIRQRRLVYMRMHNKGFSPQRIAKKYGVTVPVVWSGMRAIRKQIKEAEQAKRMAKEPKKRIEAPKFWGLETFQAGVAA